MLKALNLPRGAKDELDFGPEVAEKILKGEPLWEETKKKADDEEDDDAEGDEQEQGEKLSDEQKNLLTMFGEGKYHLIPSFFRLLIFLKKQKREFSVVFRTFGNDLPHIIWEFNQFCQGNHPCFSGRNGTPLIKFDGSKGTKNLKIEDADQQACYFRFSHELKDTKLCTGMNKRITNDMSELLEALDSVEEYEDSKLIRDIIPQFQHILETLKKRASMAIQDDYGHWKESGFHNEYAKLLLIDQADYNTQHVFFDDNANE